MSRAKKIIVSQDKNYQKYFDTMINELKKRKSSDKCENELSKIIMNYVENISFYDYSKMKKNDIDRFEQRIEWQMKDMGLTMTTFPFPEEIRKEFKKRISKKFIYDQCEEEEMNSYFIYYLQHIAEQRGIKFSINDGFVSVSYRNRETDRVERPNIGEYNNIEDYENAWENYIDNYFTNPQFD